MKPISQILKVGLLALLIAVAACSGDRDFSDEGDYGDEEEAAQEFIPGGDGGTQDNFWATDYAAGNEDANGNGYVNVGGEIVGYGPDM